jgi:hypothetical protein
MDWTFKFDSLTHSCPSLFIWFHHSGNIWCTTVNKTIVWHGYYVIYYVIFFETPFERKSQQPQFLASSPTPDPFLHQCACRLSRHHAFNRKATWCRSRLLMDRSIRTRSEWSRKEEWGVGGVHVKRTLSGWKKRLIRNNDNVVRRDAGTPWHKHSIHTSSNVSIAGGLVGSSGHLQSLCCFKVLISSLLVLRAVIL